MAKITTSKLQKLHAHFQAGGEEDGQVIADLLKVPIEELPEWEAAYQIFVREEEPAAPEPLHVVFREHTGIIRDLEIIKRKGNTVYVQDKVAKDLVTVRLRGKDTVIDVVALAKLPPASIVEAHGLSAARLIELAEMAR